MNHVGMLVGGRFEVESVAGRGGMGAVYRARDRERGGHVALKIVDAAGNRAVRFEREARVLADLEHPAIVRYLAHGRTAAGEPFLAMEWLEGEDLAARLKREPVGARDAVRLVQRAAEALGVAHARGIVHRDIKPSNLFLVGGECARVKVLDFGVAHVQADALTRTGAALGTPSYMAPEQARGERRIDARADVFSLGCVLFECMVGHPPFVGENTMAVLAKILIEDAPRVSSLRGDLPAELDDLIARLVAKDPAVRPRDGRDVAALLGVLGTITDTAVTRARDSAVTVGEQRLACVVLASRAIPLGTDPTATPTGEEATLAEASAPTLADAATPTTGRELANAPRLTALRAAALAHGGTAEVLADGSVVVTIFGRGAATDQAAQGARCALALRALLGDVAMAFAVGRCPVEDRASLGDLLDRAARLLRAPAVATAATALHRAQTGVPPIRVDDTAAGLLDARFAIDGDELGLALVGERDLAAPARTLLGKPMPCVGRERELAALTALFDECIAEPMAHVVVVTAPAGVGKSRLRHELLARIAVRDVEVWMGSGDAMNPGAPFGMLAQALRRAAGIVDGEPPLVRNMKLRARVMRHLAGDDAMRVTEFVGELVGAPVIDDGSMQLRAARRDPQLMGDQTLRACEDLVAAESSARPLLLVLEDLHWGDLPTVRFVDSVMRQLPDRPVMVLAFARPEVDVVFPRLWAERNVQRIGLGELTRRAASKLVRDALGNALDEAAVGRLVDRAAGNAFYLEELIRAVADGKDDLPDTVIAMAQTRIDDLEAEARQVLRAASIFGDTFWLDGVIALLEAQAPHVQAWLEMLVARELVVEHREPRFAGQRQYGFRHGIVREAAYAMLPERDRVHGHRIVGDWLERRGSDADAVAIAEHFERGGDPARSVGWYRRAAEHALEGHDLESAIDRAERAIAAAGDAEPAVIGALRQLQADAHLWRDEYALAIERGDAALARLPAGSPGWLAAAAAVAHGCTRKLETDRVVELCRALAAIAPTPETWRDFARAVSMTASTLLWSNESALVEQLYAKLDRIAIDASADPATLAHVGLARAWRAFHAGDFAESYRLDLATEQWHIAVGDLRQAAQQRANVGYDEMMLGAYALAEASLTDAIAMAQRMGLAQVTNQARHNLGLALARQGRLDEARAVERAALDAFAAQDAHRLASASNNYLAMIEIAAGNYAAAVDYSRAAIDKTPDAPAMRVQFHGTLSRAYHLAGDLPAALAHARIAMRMIDEQGRPEEGEVDVYVAYAEILAATGAHAHARRTLALAVARIREAAARIADPEWRDSFVRAVPIHARAFELAHAWGVD